MNEANYNKFALEYQRREVGNSALHWNKKPPKGFSKWCENGVVIHAKTVNPKFGGHDYDNGGYWQGIRDCTCGCYMLSSSSGGPVDPFGRCPANPH